MNLNNNQILYIENDLRSKGLKRAKFSAEIVDHVCCLVEQHMESGLPFSDAYRKSLEAFEDEGFIKLKKEIRSQSRGFIGRRLVSPGIAACILLFVFVVDAQDRPEIHPLRLGHKVSSKFGPRIHPISKKEKFHKGIDMPTPIGTPIKAAADGHVILIKETDGYGKHIILRHDTEYETLYANLSTFNVEEGDLVVKGQIIALSGNTGQSTAPHLHYEVKRNGQHVDPADYFTE